MHDRRQDALGIDDQLARRFRLCGYLGSSFVIGALLWGAVLSMPLITQGMAPVVVGPDKIDHPMLVQSESYLRLIEPAAGPAIEN